TRCQHRIAADRSVVSHEGARFGQHPAARSGGFHAAAEGVEVGDFHAGSEIHPAADDTVTDVIEVRHLGAGQYYLTLHFRSVVDTAALRQDDAVTQKYGMADGDVLPHPGGTADVRAGTDLGTAGNVDGTFEHRRRVDAAAPVFPDAFTESIKPLKEVPPVGRVDQILEPLRQRSAVPQFSWSGHWAITA